jgi:hypothetical protein
LDAQNGADACLNHIDICFMAIQRDGLC